MGFDYMLRASRSAVRHPRESVERIQGRIDARTDRRRLSAIGGAREVYYPVPDPLQVLHVAFGVPYPCGDAEPFAALWEAIIDGLRSAGARVGLASYRGWNDGDRAMAAAVWCAVRHLQPNSVIETGVAHGLTSRVVLEALHANNHGSLYSIDLPAVDSALHGEIGIAVPARLTERWSYVEGTSRERLPRLLSEHDDVGVFVHDSLHTGRNTRFELERVWPALRPGGVAIVDDVHRSLGLRDFVDHVRPAGWFVADHLLGSGMWGAAMKRGTSNDGRAARRASIESTPD